ncbi:MAG: phosphotransferase [Saprospiraceae bacterium]|nr:phosphotransferase [Saprospiraceae bacterium]MDW8483509.1 phosphotransferase [Saprospiraceae bacterium]
MTSEQIRDIIAQRAYPGSEEAVQLVETHISWLLLTPTYAFKIKKPLQFSFLDFSTLEKRHYYCQQEVFLNRRLAPDLYLGVLTVSADKDGFLSIRPYEEQFLLLDYVVWMHRLDNSRQMDRLLAQNAVKPCDLEALAKQLAQFHRRQVLVGADMAGETIVRYKADFEDLFAQESIARQLFGDEVEMYFEQLRQQERRFLSKHQHRLSERTCLGFWVDGHGDLHSRNIFLLPTGPVVFDCIEFSPHLRQLDVLNELAFLSMDLEARGHSSLAQVFIRAYQRHWRCIENAEDEQIFQYFKTYRANVRLKVALLQWAQEPTPETEQAARQYWQLLRRYASRPT